MSLAVDTLKIADEEFETLEGLTPFIEDYNRNPRVGRHLAFNIQRTVRHKSFVSSTTEGLGKSHPLLPRKKLACVVADLVMCSGHEQREVEVRPREAPRPWSDFPRV